MSTFGPYIFSLRSCFVVSFSFRFLSSGSEMRRLFRWAKFSANRFALPREHARRRTGAHTPIHSVTRFTRSLARQKQRLHSQETNHNFCCSDATYPAAPARLILFLLLLLLLLLLLILILCFPIGGGVYHLEEVISAAGRRVFLPARSCSSYYFFSLIVASLLSCLFVVGESRRVISEQKKILPFFHSLLLGDEVFGRRGTR